MMSAVEEVVFDRLREVEDDTLRNELNLLGHERECAIRYGHINSSVEGIRKDMRSAATTVGTIMLAILAFLIKLVFFSV